MKIFLLGGVRWGRSAPGVNLGPPHILETTRARTSKLYARLDRAKYSFQGKSFPLGALGGMGIAAPLV